MVNGILVIFVLGYYLFGTYFANSTNQEKQPYKYNGKELDRHFGLDLYDYGARFYDPLIGRFTTPDPLSEKYYSISPYAYCANNPINKIDPDGRDVFITGLLNQEALHQLQSRLGKNITLSMDENGKLSYTSNENKKLKGGSLRVADMINDNSITVNLLTTDEVVSSTGSVFVGGMFMGNTVSKDASGNISVSAFQEVNPHVLGVADEFTKTPGKMMMHELTEAYEGAKISKEAGIGAEPATKGKINSVYNEAHERATHQSPIVHVLYDKYGHKLLGDQFSEAAKIEWKVVSHTGRSKIIQT